MSTSYLHGVETVVDDSGAISVNVIRTSVIGLIGIAPKGPAQQLISVQDTGGIGQFGSKLPGFNIPQALDAIATQGYVSALVVNVWDETVMATAVTAESQVITSRKAKTAFVPVGATAPVVKDSAGTTTYVAGTDYTIDDFGNIVFLLAVPADAATIKIDYKKLNAAAVTTVLLIGSVTGAVKTGTKLFDNAYQMFGYKPKMFICPGYSHLAAMQTALLALADKFRAHAFIDGSIVASVSAAITDRGPSGVAFKTSSTRAMLMFPMVDAPVADPSVPDADPNKYVSTFYSSFFAGIVLKTDNEEGYWVSPSNHEIKGISGPSIDISAAINDPSCEANQLNAVGIVTQFNSFGTGIRTWGNRSAAFPTNTHPTNFFPVQRVQDIIDESVELAMLPFVDKPITQAVIDSVRDTVNGFLRILIGRGALVDGKNPVTGRTTGCYFNPVGSNLAAGIVNFQNEYCPPTPAEWFIFNSHIDVTYLQSIR